MGQPEVKHISIQDYLESERLAQNKHEYYRGEIFAMSGASVGHNIIFKNTYGTLFTNLKGKKCQPFGSDLRIHIPSNSLFTYPDISIICGKPETIDDKNDTVTNPKVIVEILSKSTRDYDKGLKFGLYREIESLMDYVLIDSENISVEKYSRNLDGSWLLREYKSLNDGFIIESIETDLLLKDIYDDVD